MKSFEIEQKYKCSNVSAFRSKLKKLKARLIKKGTEVNEFWDLKGKLAKQKTVLRLRKHDQTAELTLKGPKKRSRYTKRLELETRVNFNPTQAILKALDFKLSKKYSKKREVYQWRKVVITIDTLPKFGSFVELEGSVKDIAVAEKKFGLSHQDREERSYLHMLNSWED